MYSRLDSIFRTTFRHTETTDTRLGIRREDRQDTRKRKHDRKEEKPESLWEDSTSVSINALKAFLNDLLGESTEEQSTPPPKKPSGKAAQAAQAYQTTARSTDTVTAPPPTETKSNTPTIELSTKEQQAIQQLLVDLDTLSQSNIEHVKIYAADSFLESLIIGVRKAKE